MHYYNLVLTKFLLVLFYLFFFFLIVSSRGRIKPFRTEVLRTVPQKLVSISFRIKSVTFDENAYNITFYFNSTDGPTQILSSDERHVLIAEFDRCELIIYPALISDVGLYWIQLRELNSQRVINGGYTQLILEPNGELSYTVYAFHVSCYYKFSF